MLVYYKQDCRDRETGCTDCQKDSAAKALERGSRQRGGNGDVLPQNPREDGEWIQLWPDTNQRRYWLNRIANLVPLTRQRNSAAQNYDFAVKKEKYFQTKNGTSSYTLTTQVLSQAEWTPDVVSERQKYLLSVFEAEWDLSVADHEESSEWYLAGRGSNATGYLLDGESIRVKVGSIVAPTITEGFQKGYLDLRQELLQNGIIVNNAFVVDYTFDSVSAAAAVILGRSANGRKEWMKLDGRTIAQVGQEFLCTPVNANRQRKKKRVSLHETRGNRVKIHDSRPQSCKFTRQPERIV